MNRELQRLRSYYAEETLDQDRVDALWQELSGRLSDRQYHKHRFTFQYATFFAALTLFLTIGMAAIHAAAPSSPLYPVRMLSESTVAQISGKYDVILEHRTDAIINAAQKKSDIEIKKAAEEYEETLKQAQERNKPNEEAKEELKDTLKQSEEKLKSVTPPSTEAKNLLNKSIKATEKTRQEVKGVQLENESMKAIPSLVPSSPGQSDNSGSQSGNNGVKNNGNAASENANAKNNGSAAEEHRKNKN